MGKKKAGGEFSHLIRARRSEEGAEAGSGINVAKYHENM